MLSLSQQDFEAHLEKVFGHAQFRPGQRQVLEHVLQGSSALLLMPTGFGKSLCYQFPASLAQGNELVLVISPLIALMQDQVSQLRRQNVAIHATFINSSLSTEERQQRYEQIRQGRFQLLFVTPERFRKKEFRQALENRKVILFAVDEAHCVSQWGHDFRTEYSRLDQHIQSLGNPVVLALTATATVETQSDILQQLGIPDAKVFSQGVERPNLSLRVHSVHGWDEKVRALVGLRFQNPGSGIIYVSLIQSLYKMTSELRRLGIDPLVYHGDLSSQDRRRSQENFLKQSDALMVATPAFGLGIDKPNVRWVAHTELPGSLEAYFQEVGRAGRDGLDSNCDLLLDQDDVSIQAEFIKWANPDGNFIHTLFRKIQDNPLRLQQEGVDFLREQMNFRNSRDFRVETAVQLLQRWGVLEESAQKSRFPWKVVQDLDPSDLTEWEKKDRVRTQQKKLLEMLRFAQMTEGCRLQTIYKYFGHTMEKTCGKCDLCLVASDQIM